MHRPSSPWSCPPDSSDRTAPLPSDDKDRDGKLDRKYAHYVDESGRDFQVWCLDHGSTGDYAYYSSAPGRQDAKVSACLLICGQNSGDFTIANGTGMIISRPDINGTKQYIMNGTFSGYNHTNWVPTGHPSSPHAGSDYHFYYNWTTGKVTQFTTMINATTGEHKIISAREVILSYSPTQETDSDGEAFALFEESFPSFEGSQVIGTEVEEVDPQFIVQRQEIPVMMSASDGVTTPQLFEIFYPSQVGLSQLEFDAASKSLYISMGEQHSSYFNIAIPRTLLDHDDEQFVVFVDDSSVEYEEKTSPTYRVLTFPINEETQSITITGSYAAPEFPSMMMLLALSVTAIVAFMTIKARSRSMFS